MHTDKPLNIFWTGGWDSTFHLLDLVANRGLPVQPHYIIDEDRESTMAEIGAIRKLKQRIFTAFPQTSELIRPTRISTKFDLTLSQNTRDAYRHVQSDFPALGSQYAWLTQYCLDQQIDDMRVCIEKSEATTTSGPAHIYTIFLNQSEKFDDHDGHAYRILANHGNKEFFFLFGRYLLPLLDITKMEMAELAAKRGWTEIMKRTWFCHWPTRRGKPCGRCNPCLLVKGEGMSWRLPLSARIKSIFSKGY
jgi:hypothetical protein